MDEYCLHAERIGDHASMLAARRTKAVERIFGDVVAALHRDLLDSVGHILNGNADEPIGHLLRSAPIADLHRQLRECSADSILVERLITTWPKNLREPGRRKLANHDVGIGDRQRPAAPVAFRARR
jgi:hypothetical protein